MSNKGRRPALGLGAERPEQHASPPSCDHRLIRPSVQVPFSAPNGMMQSPYPAAPFGGSAATVSEMHVPG